MDNIVLFDENAEQYDQWFERNQHILASEIAAIKLVMPDFSKGIEIGVGTGVFAAQLGIQHGVEPAKHMREKASARGIQVIDALAEHLPIENEVYDFAMMVTVDCFLKDILQAFKEVRRILKVNGYFIIAFIDKNAPLGRIYDLKKHTSEFYKPAVFHSACEIRAYLQKAGFAVVDERQTIFDLENKVQESKPGVGEGVFAILKARKIPMQCDLAQEGYSIV
ncbi:MAG: class I SAM-dependent methyltransferase [Negativicutes bacterium]